MQPRSQKVSPDYLNLLTAFTQVETPVREIEGEREARRIGPPTVVQL